MATPVGNLEDVTLRALAVLERVDVIACEDTRHTRKLLDRHGIQAPMVSCHEHNEEARAADLVERLLGGRDVALVTDAGTPLVSDPGYRVVCLALEKGVRVSPVPGASSAMAALSVSGLPTDRFLFAGFPPKKAGKKRRMLEDLCSRPETLVFFESPQRVAGLLRDLLEEGGDRPAALCRELTKVHEEVVRGALSEILEKVEAAGKVRGECTLVVGGLLETGPAPEEDLARAVSEALERGESPGRAASLAAAKTGHSRKAAYQMVLDLTRGPKASIYNPEEPLK